MCPKVELFEVFPLNVLSPLSFMKKYVDVVLDSEKPLVSHVSKSPVEVANSLLHDLQIDTSPTRNSLFHSKSDDIESGIAIAMSFASPKLPLLTLKLLTKVLVLVLLI